MSAPHVQPPALRGRAFTRREALAHGLSDRQLDSGRYRRLAQGIWVAADLPVPADPRAALLQVLPAIAHDLPERTLCSTTAAIFWGMRLPARAQQVWPLHVAVPDGRRVRRDGVIGHRIRRGLLLRDAPHGLRVTGPARTLVDLAGQLTFPELVAVVDGVICCHRHGPLRGRPPLQSRDRLRQEVTALRGVRGAPTVRAALAHAAIGVDSPMETRLRLILEEHGFTDFRPDLLLTGDDGYPVLPDLGDPELRISLQYEGSLHERPGQRQRDIARQRATVQAGWTEIRVTAADLTETELLDGRTVPRVVALVARTLRS